MKIALIVIALALGGCAAEVGIGHHGAGAAVSVGAPAAVYYWEPTDQVWFYFDGNGRRQYMQRGWRHPQHGEYGRPEHQYRINR